MKYMGSKNRISKLIIPIITKGRTTETFYDLFCGGGNVIDKIKGSRVANDNDKYVIALLKEMQKETFKAPEHIGETEYKNIKNNKDNYQDWLVGYVGYQLSFGAKFFGGYRRDSSGFRDYEKEAQRNIMKQQKLIKGAEIEFHCDSYENIPIKPNSYIYCDIPYKNTTKYNTSKNFDYDKFYKWCVDMKNLGHKIFISEYDMPEEIFECIWQKEIGSSLTPQNNGKKGIEKIFVVR